MLLLPCPLVKQINCLAAQFSSIISKLGFYTTEKRRQTTTDLFKQAITKFNPRLGKKKKRKLLLLLGCWKKSAEKKEGEIVQEGKKWLGNQESG